MIALSLLFTSGRFHATAWDHHVNEGVPEWPPSPWRIVRALVAAAFRLEGDEHDVARRVVLRLASELPVYHLPATAEAHTRHYMPIPTVGKPDLTTKVFDAFVAVGAGAGDPEARVVVAWPSLSLSPDEAEVLDRMLRQLAYLGRAESWVEATRCAALPDGVERLVPVVGEGEGADATLFAPRTPDAYAAWREGYLDHGGKKKDVPADLWEALRQDTGALQKAGWSRAPGARQVAYVSEAAAVDVHRRPVDRGSAAPPTVLRFALQAKVLPPVQATLSVAERFKQALTKASATDLQGTDTSHPVFDGHDPETTERAEGHLHAFVLPVDDDGDGFLDHVLVVARGGFDDDALRAAQQVRRVYGGGDVLLDVTLIGWGQVADFGTELGGGRGTGSQSPVLGRSTTWVSATPFVRNLHTKVRGGVVKYGAADQVRRACVALGLPEPVAIEPTDASPVGVRWSRFRRTRRHGGGSQGGDRGFGWRLRFAEPVQGPLALGYGAHFGLGVFVAVRD